MSCDITTFAEVRIKKTLQWEKAKKVFSYYDNRKTEHPFSWQDYGLFGFLADVRNYSYCEPIKIPMGLPMQLSQQVQSEWESEKWSSHSASYLKLSDLLAFDYDKTFINQRFGDEDYLKTMTYREFLGDLFFTNLKELQQLGEPNDVRVIFWFDN